MQKIQDKVDSKSDSVAKTLSDGENIIGNCHVTNSTPARELLNKLSNEWENLKEMLAEK